MKRMLFPSSEKKLTSCPFMTPDLTPCKTKFLVEQTEDVRFISVHLFSHIPQMVHSQKEKLLQLMLNVKSGKVCPFQHCQQELCVTGPATVFQQCHWIELTIFLLLSVVDSKHKLVSNITDLADNKVKDHLKSIHSVYKPDIQELTYQHGNDELDDVSSNYDHLDDVIAQCDPYNDEQEHVCGDSGKKNEKDNNDKDDAAVIHNTIDKNGEILNTLQVNIQEEEDTPSCDEQENNFSCSYCKSLFPTVADLYSHTEQYHLRRTYTFPQEETKNANDSDSNENTVTDELCGEIPYFSSIENSAEDKLPKEYGLSSDTEVEDPNKLGSSLKRTLKVSLHDISYSKKWNRKVCSSFKKFIASQSDQYVLDHYYFKPPKLCKVINCNFTGDDCAAMMKHIRYGHVKNQS